MTLPPKTSYLLCTSPRSGSTMCCDLLASTRVAGNPNSFFRPQSIADFCSAWDVPETAIETFDQSYIDTALERGSAGTGCFGMRIMFSNMASLQARLTQLYPDADADVTRLSKAFGPLRFIHLTRTNKVAQAISYVRAEQSGLWHRHSDGRERERSPIDAESGYDHAQIAEKYKLLMGEKSGWTQWFNENAIKPLTITYEDLAADPHREMRRVFAYLDLSIDGLAQMACDTSRLSDVTSIEWETRFRAEAGLAL